MSEQTSQSANAVLAWPKLDLLSWGEGKYFLRWELVKHSKGGVYLITGTPDKYVLEHDRSPAYAYLMDDGRVCVRTQSEFEDGRFTHLPVEEVRALAIGGKLDWVMAYFNEVRYGVP